MESSKLINYLTDSLKYCDVGLTCGSENPSWEVTYLKLMHFLSRFLLCCSSRVFGEQEDSVAVHHI
jgi:hypothetical protein